MNKGRPQSVLEAMLLALVVSGLICVTSVMGEELPADMRQFVDSFIAAAKQKDQTQIRELTHRATLNFATPAEAEFYERLVQGQFRIFGSNDPIKEVRYEKFAELDHQKLNNSMNKLNIGWQFPPDGRIIVTFDAPDRSRKAAIFVARDGEEWRWVHVSRNYGQEQKN